MPCHLSLLISLGFSFSLFFFQEVVATLESSKHSNIHIDAILTVGVAPVFLPSSLIRPHPTTQKNKNGPPSPCVVGKLRMHKANALAPKLATEVEV